MGLRRINDPFSFEKLHGIDRDDGGRLRNELACTAAIPTPPTAITATGRPRFDLSTLTASSPSRSNARSR